MLEGEGLNSPFATLQEWKRHPASVDFDNLPKYNEPIIK